jgi:hypothetical protein
LRRGRAGLPVQRRQSHGSAQGHSQHSRFRGEAREKSHRRHVAGQGCQDWKIRELRSHRPHLRTRCNRSNPDRLARRRWRVNVLRGPRAAPPRLFQKDAVQAIETLGRIIPSRNRLSPTPCSAAPLSLP